MVHILRMDIDLNFKLVESEYAQSIEHTGSEIQKAFGHKGLGRKGEVRVGDTDQKVSNMERRIIVKE